MEGILKPLEEVTNIIGEEIGEGISQAFKENPESINIEQIQKDIQRDIDIKANLNADSYNVLKKSGKLSKILNIFKQNKNMDPIRKSIYKALLEGRISAQTSLEDVEKIYQEIQQKYIPKDVLNELQMQKFDKKMTTSQQLEDIVSQEAKSNEDRLQINKEIQIMINDIKNTDTTKSGMNKLIEKYKLKPKSLQDFKNQLKEAIKEEAQLQRKQILKTEEELVSKQKQLVDKEKYETAINKIDYDSKIEEVKNNIRQSAEKKQDDVFNTIFDKQGQLKVSLSNDKEIQDFFNKNVWSDVDKEISTKEEAFNKFKQRIADKVKSTKEMDQIVSQKFEPIEHDIDKFESQQEKDEALRKSKFDKLEQEIRNRTQLQKESSQLLNRYKNVKKLTQSQKQQLYNDMQEKIEQLSKDDHHSLQMYKISLQGRANDLIKELEEIPQRADQQIRTQINEIDDEIGRDHNIEEPLPAESDLVDQHDYDQDHRDALESRNQNRPQGDSMGKKVLKGVAKGLVFTGAEESIRRGINDAIDDQIKKIDGDDKDKPKNPNIPKQPNEDPSNNKPGQDEHVSDNIDQTINPNQYQNYYDQRQYNDNRKVYNDNRKVYNDNRQIIDSFNQLKDNQQQIKSQLQDTKDQHVDRLQILTDNLQLLD